MGRARTLHILSIASACGGLGCVAGAALSSAAGGAAPFAWSGLALLGVAAGCGRVAFRSRRRTSDDELARREAAAAAAARELKVRLALAEAERQHAQAILYSISDAVLVTDTADAVVLANESAARTFEFDLARAGHAPVADLLGDPNVLRLIRDTRQGRTGTGRRVVEHQVNTPGGRRTFKITLSPLPAPGLEADGPATAGTAATAEMTAGSRATATAATAAAAPPAGVVLVLHDVTREREVSEMKNEFVSMVSHELRTPLASIKAYIEMLIDGEAVDERTTREFYDVIQNEANRLGRLIDNILNISRIESGLVKVNKQPQPLTQIIREALESVAPQAAQKRIKLVEQSAPPPGPRPCGDRDMLYQVVLNLLANAVKHTPDGGTITIESSVVDGGRKVVTRITDTGAGIPPKDLPFVFDKFAQSGGNARVVTGTGLGLSLARHIVETVHGGRMFVESHVGRGSCFGFELDGCG